MADQQEEQVPQEAEAPPTEPATEQTEAPAEQTEAPAEQTEAPAEQTEAPAEQTEAPAEQTEAPAEQAEAPAEQTEAPAETTEAPAEQTEAPTEQKEASEEQTEAPAETEPLTEQTEPAAEQTEGNETEPPKLEETEAAPEEGQEQVQPESSPAEGEQQQAVTEETSPTEEEATPTEVTPSTEEQKEQAEEDSQEKPSQEEEGGQEQQEEQAPTTDAVGTSTEPNAEHNEDVDPHAPSPDNTPLTGRYDPEATATVKFVFMPSGQVATLRCHLGQTLAELRAHFSSELKMPVDVLLLLFDGKAASETITLGDLGVGPNGTIRLELQSVDPINSPLKPFRPRQEHTMPDVITVRVPVDDGGYKDVVVEIEKTIKKKPFLGGYKHKQTSVEYHHASAQTVQKQRSGSSAEKFCRDTQTTQQKHIYQQTTNSTSTQMTKIGVYVPNIPDKLMVPGKYITADQHKAKLLNQVVVIQKYYRRWLARRYVNKVRVDKSRRLAWEREEEVRKKKEKEERIKREFERRMNPKTKEDFDLLYHALEKWRQEEVGRINAELTGAERKAALCQLLEQETQLIASVGRHKLEADDDTRNTIIQKFLDKAAAPKRWRGPDGKMTEMDTPYTIRAQQLRDIYNSINMKYLTQDERLDVLLTLKHTVKEHDCKLTQEIIELIDREADLLMRGVKETNLDGLRKRIATLFLQYIKTPTFNPEAARLIKVPQDASTLRRNIYFCSSCNQYLPSTEFQLSSNSRAAGKCRNCNKTDNEARIRQDYSHYRFLLKNLRRQEDAYADGSKIAFLLQEGDLRYLVENVWNSQSILSAWHDLYDLTLVRWIRTDEWSPWNCILLTKEEASAHEKLENLEEAYGKVFIHRVQHKHTLARQYFSRLPGMSEHMRTRAASSSLGGRQGPSVSGKSLSTLQGSAIKAQ